MAPSPLLLGVTATPDRGDQRGLAEVFSQITYQKTILEMIAAGYLCDLRAKQVKVKADFSALSVRAGDFRAEEVAEVLLDGQAPELVAQAVIEHAPDRRTLAFTPTVAIAHALADELHQRGVLAEAIDGTTPIDQRRDVLHHFASGDLQAVTNCNVLTEGFDGPWIDCIVIARPTRSRPLYVQMVGRGTRPYPEKPDCLVLDVVGVTTRHDLVTMAGLAGVHPTGLGDQTVTEALNKGRGQPAPAGSWAAELDAKDVDLFNRREMNWVKASHRHVLSTWDGHIALEPTGGAWAVVRHQRDAAPSVVAKGLSLEWAQGTAEDLARKLGAGALVDRSAPWRSRPASDKQLDAFASHEDSGRAGHQRRRGQRSDLGWSRPVEGEGVVSQLLLAALAYAADRDWEVFPLGEGSKLPKIPKVDGGRGFYDATRDPCQLRAWWGRWPRANVGIRTGPSSNVAVLDVDPRHRGDVSLEALEANHAKLPHTLCARTPSGGTHWYFIWPGVELRNSVSVLDDGLDIRANGGYVAAAPSVVTRVGDYSWIDEGVPIATMPSWLVRLLRKPKDQDRPPRTVELPRGAARTVADRVLADRARQVASAPERRRNNTLNTAAFYLGTLAGAGLLDTTDIWRTLTDAAISTGLGEREVRATIASGLSAGLAQPQRWSA